MKFQAAVSLALAGTVLAAGNADTVNKVLAAINTDLGKFDQAIKSYSGGSDVSAMTAASEQIEKDTVSGAKDIAAGEALSTTDAVSITTSVSGLQISLDQALGDLKGISEKLAAAGQCSTFQSQLDSQSAAASQLADAITSKTPQDLKGVGSQLSGQISTSIKGTQDHFKTACANAPSAPPAGGKEGGSGGKEGGKSGKEGGKSGGSSSAGPVSGSSSPGSSTPSGGASPAGGKEAGPKKASPSSPAVQTGAGSSFTVPALLCALALAIATL